MDNANIVMALLEKTKPKVKILLILIKNLFKMTLLGLNHHDIDDYSEGLKAHLNFYFE